MIAGGIHKFLQTNYAIFQHSGHPIVVVKGAKFIQDFRTNPLFLEAPLDKYAFGDCVKVFADTRIIQQVLTSGFKPNLHKFLILLRDSVPAVRLSGQHRSDD